MANKLIISESQYERLLQRLDETPFDVMVDNTMQVGDRVNVFHRDGKNSFRVKEVNPSGITMIGDDENDSASRFYDYFMNEHSLKNNSLEMRRVDNRDKEKVEDIAKWDTIHFNDVKNVEVIRERKRVDRLDPPNTQEPNQEPNQEPDQETDQDGNDTTKNERDFELGTLISDIISTLKVGIRLELNTGRGDNIHLCCLEQLGSNPIFYTFEIDESSYTTVPQLSQYENFYLKLINQNAQQPPIVNKKNIYLTDDTNEVNIVLKAVSGNNADYFEIKDVINYGFNKCNTEEPEEEPEAPEEQPEEETPPNPNDTASDTETDELEDGKTLPEKGYDYDSIYNRIISDKAMQKAFFSQPSFWESFVAALKGKKAPNKGIMAALKYMGRFMKAKLDKKIGAGFNESGNKEVKFNPMDTYLVPFTKTWVDKTEPKPTLEYFTFAKETRPKSGIIRNFMVDPNDGLAITHNIDIKDNNGNNLYLYIVVNGKTTNNDVKQCHLIINPDKKSPKGGDYLGQYSGTAQVQFFQSAGYNPNEGQQKNK